MPPETPPPSPAETPPAGPQPLYVSCVDGKPVTRYRLGGRGPRALGDPIGAERGEGRAWTYYPERVVMIPADEVATFGRIYERAIVDGHLVRRTAEDFAAQNKTSEAPASPNGSAPPAGGTDT